MRGANTSFFWQSRRLVQVFGLRSGLIGLRSEILTDRQMKGHGSKFWAEEGRGDCGVAHTAQHRGSRKIHRRRTQHATEMDERPGVFCLLPGSQTCRLRTI